MEIRRSTAGGCVLNQSKESKSTSRGRVAATSFDFFVIGEERKLNSGSDILDETFPVDRLTQIKDIWLDLGQRRMLE
jgi:hypothetical protein